MRFFRLIGNGLFAMLDLVMGIFLVFVTQKILRQEVHWAFYFLGMFLAVLPDLDVLYMYARYKRVQGNHHEYLTHRPLVGVTLAAVIGWFAGGWFWCLTASACLFWHYLHDTEGFGGGGIAWAWPLSRKYLSPFGSLDPQLSSLLGDHNAGMEREVLQPSLKSVTEVFLSAVLLGVVGGGWFGSRIGTIVAASVFSSVLCFWHVYDRVKSRRESMPARPSES